jgi:hypothetical protein
VSPHLSPDAKAIVRAAEAMTAEVRRIADALEKPATPRLLDCGLCYEENGEECHPHPECPIGHGSPDLRLPNAKDIVDEALRTLGAKAMAATPLEVREQIAEALYRHDHSGWSMRLVDSDIKDAYLARADAVLPVILPTTRLLGELHRSAHEDVQRVIGLYEQWVKAGPPPLGASMARWWDARLAELHAAINPPEHAEDPT